MGSINPGKYPIMCRPMSGRHFFDIAAHRSTLAVAEIVVGLG
jgi:hypothetical protein